MELSLLIVSNTLVVFVNLFFVIIYYLQLREAKRAILLTKFTQSTEDKKQKVLELKPLYLHIDNQSKNTVRNLVVKKKLVFGKRNLLLKATKISVLNPYEGVKILIRTGKIMEKYPFLFDEKNTKNKEGYETILKVPKETLKINFEVEMKWRFFHKQKDNYEIEWGGLNNYTRLKDHPIMFSWNKRNGEYIYKLE